MKLFRSALMMSFSCQYSIEIFINLPMSLCLYFRNDGRSVTPEESYEKRIIQSSTAKKPNKIKRTQSFRIKKSCSQDDLIDVDVDPQNEYKESSWFVSKKVRMYLVPCKTSAI